MRAGDARDPASLSRVLEGVDTVISAMQFPNYPVENEKKGYTFHEIDARGNQRLVAAATEAGVRSYVIVWCGSRAGCVAKHWFRAKWEAEQAIIGSGLALRNLPAIVGLRAGGRLDESVRDLRPQAALRAGDRRGQAADAAGLRPGCVPLHLG